MDLKEVVKVADQKATAKTSVLLEETRVFEPPKELVENSNVMKWMKEKVFRKKVTVEIQSYEGEEYLVGTVRLGEADLSLQLVEAGLAWYDKKLGANRDLSKAQKRARKAKIGLWAQEDPVPPWEIKARSEKEKAAAEKKKKKEN